MSSEAHRLSALESAFLGLESRDVPFVYACVLHFDRPIPLDPLRAHFDAVLAELPRYRQRIDHGWLMARWVEDDQFRIERQIHSIWVAEPGGAAELDRLTGELLETELPAGHPQWRLWTIEGLAEGRGAVIALVHHSLVDGIAGIHMLERALGAVPAATPHVAAPRAARRVRPRRSRRIAAVRRLARWKTVTALARLIRDGVRPASEIGLNPRHVGRHRVVASHTVDLEAVRAIEHAFQATNNDVVLATVAGALRRFLSRRGLDPDQLRDVRTMVPVGRHRKDEHDTSGNRVVLLLAELPVYEADPGACLRHVSAMTKGLKTGQSAEGGELLVAISELTTPALLVGVLWVALRMRGFNTIVTNVPGPPRPLSLLGAQLTRMVPIVNLWPYQALGIAVASYGGTMTFGVQADRSVIPDLAGFREDLAAAFGALAEVAAHDRATSLGGEPRARSMQIER